MTDSYSVAPWALKSRHSLRSLLTLKKEKNNKWMVQYGNVNRHVIRSDSQIFRKNKHLLW